MNKTIDRFRQRRFKRLMSRLDAAEGHFDEEGHWVTTHETKRHIHLNEKGVPDKGNPYIIAKMTGTKPKLSPEYRKKSLKESLAKEDLSKTVHSLKSLTEGSTITLENGTQYTKKGSGFVSSKGKTGVKQTPQAMAKILGNKAKAGKDFEIAPSDIGGAPGADKNTGAPTPGASSPATPLEQTATPSGTSIDEIKKKMKSDMETAIANKDIDAISEIVKQVDQLPPGAKFTSADGIDFVKTTDGKFTPIAKPWDPFNSDNIVAMMKDAVKHGEDFGLEILGTSSTAPAPASAPVSNAVTESSLAQKKIQDLIDKGHETTASAFEKELDQFPTGTKIAINGKQYEKFVTGDWLDSDTGMPFGDAWDVGYEIKQAMHSGSPSVKVALPGEPGQDTPASAATPASASAPVDAVPDTSATANTPAQDSPEVHDLKAVLDTWSAGKQIPSMIAVSTLESLQDGTLLEVDGNLWVKTSDLISGKPGFVEALTNTKISAGGLADGIKQSIEGKGKIGINGAEYTPNAAAPDDDDDDDEGGQSAASASAATPVSAPAEDYHAQKKNIQDLIDNGEYSSSAYEKDLDQLPAGTTVTIDGKQYEKNPAGDWLDGETGMPFGESWDLGYEITKKMLHSNKPDVDISVPGKTGQDTPALAATPASAPVQPDAPEIKNLKTVLDAWAEGSQVGPMAAQTLKALPDGTTIEVDGVKWKKNGSDFTTKNPWKPDGVGPLLTDIKAAIKAGKGVGINGAEYTPSQGSAASQSTGSVTPQEAGSTPSQPNPAQFAMSLSGIKGVAEKMQTGKILTSGEFKGACKAMKDGDGINMNGKTYTKGTDAFGDPVFHPSDDSSKSFSAETVKNIMSYQIGLQKNGLSNGVSFKSVAESSPAGGSAGSEAVNALKSLAAKGSTDAALIQSALKTVPDGTTIKVGSFTYTKTTKQNAVGDDETVYTSSGGGEWSTKGLAAKVTYFSKQGEQMVVGEGQQTAEPTKTNPSEVSTSFSAMNAQKSIKSAKTKADALKALKDLPDGAKIQMKNAYGSTFIKKGTVFKLQSSNYPPGTGPALLADDIIKYVHGKSKYAAPFAVTGPDGKSTKYSDGTPVTASTGATSPGPGASSGGYSSPAQSAGATAPANVGAAKGKVMHPPEAFSQARKDAAHWDKSGGHKTDDLMHSVTGAAWAKFSESQKKSLAAYTGSAYSDINHALRKGDTGDQSTQSHIKNMTAAIDQCEAPTDIWLQRGTNATAISKLFNVSEYQLNSAMSNGPQAVLDLLTSSANFAQDKGFMSCGSAKGKGFTKDITLNLYCPKGTKMIYAEPFSVYGTAGAGASWDGKSKAGSISSEDETILQRGTMMVPRKVSFKKGKMYIDVDVIGQDY